jgi:hypothetical protein
MNFILGRIATEMEKTLPNAPVRVNAKEGLAESDKAGNAQNRIWCELVQLHAIDKQNPTKKFIGRKRKSTKEESKEHHSVAVLRFKDDLGAGEDALRRCRKEALFFGLRRIRF